MSFVEDKKTRRDMVAYTDTCRTEALKRGWIVDLISIKDAYNRIWVYDMDRTPRIRKEGGVGVTVRGLKELREVME